MLFVSPGVFPYVPQSERSKPEPEQVVFDLAVLSAREFARVQDDALDELGLGMRRGSYIYSLLRRAVRGVKGPGAPEYAADEHGYATDDFLSFLSGELKTELAGVLDEWTTVGRESGKASES